MPPPAAQSHAPCTLIFLYMRTNTTHPALNSCPVLRWRADKQQQQQHHPPPRWPGRSLHVPAGNLLTFIDRWPAHPADAPDQTHPYCTPPASVQCRTTTHSPLCIQVPSAPSSAAMFCSRPWSRAPICVLMLCRKPPSTIGLGPVPPHPTTSSLLEPHAHQLFTACLLHHTSPKFQPCSQPNRPSYPSQL